VQIQFKLFKLVNQNLRFFAQARPERFEKRSVLEVHEHLRSARTQPE